MFSVFLSVHRGRGVPEFWSSECLKFLEGVPVWLPSPVSDPVGWGSQELFSKIFSWISSNNFSGGQGGSPRIEFLGGLNNFFCKFFSGGGKNFFFLFCQQIFFCNLFCQIFFVGGQKKFIGAEKKLFFGALEVKPEVNWPEVDPEGRGSGSTPLAVMQENCLVLCTFTLLLSLHNMFTVYQEINHSIPNLVVCV